METKKLNTTDPISNLNHTTGSPFNNLNQPDAVYDNSNARWTCRNVPNPKNQFGAPYSAMNPYQMNPYQMADAPTIYARSASATALAPFSTNEEKFFITGSYDRIKDDLKSDRFLGTLWSREIFSNEDKEEIEAMKTRFKKAELIISKIQEKFARAGSDDNKQVLMYVIYDTFSRIQPHLVRFLTTNHVKSYENYNSNVQYSIHILMGPDSPRLKIQHRQNLVRPGINSLPPRQNPTTPHHGLNRNDRACEHDDTHQMVYGTKEQFPVQESGGHNRR